MYRRWILILSMVFLISSCAGIDPKTLATSHVDAYISLTHDMSYTGKRGLYKFEEGIKKGIYKAEYQDNLGIYFRGPPNCTFTTPDSDGITRIYEGGVWIPKNWDMKQTRIYSYFSEKDFYDKNPRIREINGLLEDVLIHADDGKIILWPIIEDANFIADLNQQLIK